MTESVGNIDLSDASTELEDKPPTKRTKVSSKKRWSRKVAPVYVQLNISQTQDRPLTYPGVSALDLDSHADTCVLGNNALLVESPHLERTAIVSFAIPQLEQ